MCAKLFNFVQSDAARDGSNDVTANIRQSLGGDVIAYFDDLETAIESGTRVGGRKAYIARRIWGHRNGPMPRLTDER